MKSRIRHIKDRRRQLLKEFEQFVKSADNLKQQNKPASNRIKDYFKEIVSIESELVKAGYQIHSLSNLFSEDTLIWLELIKKKEPLNVVEQ